MSPFTAEQWTQVKSYFARALEMPTSSRAQWLQSQDHLPASVREEVERLLAADCGGAAPPPPPASSLPVGAVVAGRFHIKTLLGRGGMGEVYLVHDQLLNVDVALKRVRADLVSDRAFASRLEEEVRAARCVHHDHVCRIFDLHRDPDGSTFLTMEFLDGPTLSQKLAHGALPPGDFLRLASEMALGLDAIHLAGVVHRDLKPANLFLLPRTVIADFGLAYSPALPVTQTISLFGPDAIVGTPAYMAPEQLLGQSSGPAVDIHAFGAILFEAFSGSRAFQGQTPLAVALKRLSNDALPVHDAIPAPWLKAIHACLARDPRARPVSAQAVLDLATRPPRFAISRRSLLASTLVLGAGAAGTAIWKSRSAPISPEARYHFKLAQEYAKRTSRADILAAIAEFRKATALDPKFATAWAGLADAYCAAANYAALPTRQARAEAETAASRAPQFDPSSSVAQAALTYVLSTDLRRWAQAGPYFERVIRQSPDEPVIRSRYAGYLGRRERADEAIRMARSAIELDPGQLRFQNQLTVELTRARRFEDALRHARSVVVIHSTSADAHIGLCRTLEWNHLYAEAESELQIAERLFEEGDVTAYRATLRQAQGRRQEAVRLADAYFAQWRQGKREANTAASVEAALGRIENLFEIIDKAYAQEEDTVLAIPSNPYMIPLRLEPRMRAFRARLGLPNGA